MNNQVRAGELSAPASEHARSPTQPGDLTRANAPGLSTAEARARLARDGPNELPPQRRDSLAARLARELREPMALLLLAAALVAGLGLHERVDAAVIAAIVVANVIIALIQQGKAAHALEALRHMETHHATVTRDGRVARIPSRELVEGDHVLLAAGDRVPADLALTRTATLEVDESMLTGESLAVSKDAGAQRSGGVIGQASLAFSGTLVVRGTGDGTVVATGVGTQLGRIAQRLDEREPPTPLELELRAMTSRLGVVAVFIAVAVFALTLLRGGLTSADLQVAFLSAAALAVAAVPEGLPTVVTVALALGVRRMAARGAIVRRLPAVETLGSTTVILTDKTGTLTQNKMKVELASIGGAPAIAPDESNPFVRELIWECAALCNDATIDPPTGDPMEVALLNAIGTERVAEIRGRLSRRGEEPFDSARRRMATLNGPSDGPVLNGSRGRFVLNVKGAPEEILGRCTSFVPPQLDAHVSSRPSGEVTEHATQVLDAGTRDAIEERAREMAERGARVIAFARKHLVRAPPTLGAEEHSLTFLGLIGIRDPVRAGAPAAVAAARAAGIRILMVTGDHAGTALAIAQEVGLASDGAPATTGAAMREAGLPVDPLDTPVYARVDPDDKLALAVALQARGHVVAVTGDGVNDAPALRRADIGVAMGRTGSDVARESADMIVTDDDLATIVTAVREGRGIYDNVRKVVDYLVAGNLSEIMVVVSSLVLFPGLGVPLLPLQLLWINLLTDGLPSVALAVDPVDPGLMDRAPRPRGDRLLGSSSFTLLMGRAMLITVAVVGSLAIERFVWHEPWPHARAVMFTVLMTAHLLYAFVARLPRTGRGGMRPNRWLVLAVLTGIVLQLIVVTVPALRDVFGTAVLIGREWALVLTAGMAPVAIMGAARTLAGRVGRRGTQARRPARPAPTAASPSAVRAGGKAMR